MGLLGDVAGALTGGIIGTSATEEAAKEAKKLSKEAARKSEGEFGEAWKDIEGMITPFIDAGTESLGAYKEAIGVTPDTPVFEEFDFDFDMSKMEDSDAYKFIMGEEMQATNRIAAQNRGLTSGNRLTAIQDRAAGVASTEYGNEWDRQWKQQFESNKYNNELMAAKYGMDYGQTRDAQADRSYLIGSGQTAATNLSNQRMVQANSLSNIWNRQAADVTAANLLPGQEQQNFVGGLMGMGGQLLGSK